MTEAVSGSALAETRLFRHWRGWLAAGVLAVYVIGGWAALHAHTDPTEMDTVAYLDAALDIRETGGILNHIPNLIRGVYTEATQHPLYLLIISPFAEHHIRFFVTAKSISFVIGAIFLIFYLLTIREWFGDGTAVGAGWLWATSAGFLTLVTTVACEGLLGVFVIGFWYCLASGRDDRRWWYAAGVCAGLGFLTKSIGIFMLPVFVLSAVWWDRRNLMALVKSKAFWGFFIIFILIALPLFIRNSVVYGTPLYSDSSGVMWVDHWRDFSRERAADGRISMAIYLRSHTPLEIVRIFWEGISYRVPMMIMDGLKPLPFWKPIDPEYLRGFYHPTVSWQGPWAACVMAFAAFGWWVHRRHASAVPALGLWAIFAVFVGWYSKVFPSTPPTRLMYPVLLLVPVYASAGLYALIQKLPSQWQRYRKVGALGIIGLTAAGLLVHGGWAGKSIKESYVYSPLLKIQMALAEKAAKPGEKVMVSTYFFNHLFYFKDKLKAQYLDWPKADSMSDLSGFIQKNQIRYAFVDLATVFYNPQILGEYYRAERSGTIVKLKPMPPIFKQIPLHPSISTSFDLYAIQTN